MKKQMILIPLLAVFSLAFALAAGQSAYDLFQKALTMEQTAGDLEGAISLYQKVVDSAREESLAAQAQLRIGVCYEKLGNAMAVKAFEEVLNRFPKQTDAVAEAKARLAVLRKEEPAGLTLTRLLPPDVYLECQRLSPDGTKVAGIDFSKGQNVAVFDLAAGRLEFITNFDWERRYTYVTIWSPDSKEVAYQEGNIGSPISELWTSTLDGKSLALFKNPHGNIAPCDWLTDGSAIVAFLENENKTYSLGLVSVKDGNFRELCPLSRTYSQRGDVTQALAGASADSSPDGRFIAFSDGPPDGSRDIYSISKDGSSKEPLTDHPADDKEPRWSPDGRFVVFLSDRHGSWALWGIEVGDGHPEGDPFMVLEGDTELASWTKKGLVTRTSVAIRDIYTLEIDPQSLEARGKPRILDFTPSGSSFRPLFSPDGKHLAFTKFPLPTEKFPPSFFVKPSEGGEARQYENPARIWQWLPDSSGLCFLGVDEEKRPLFKRLEVDSGEWETASIPGTGLPQPTAPSVVFSSDGKTIFYTKMGKNRSDRGILAYSLETGQERSLYHTQTDDPQYLSLDASNDHKRLITGLWGRILILDADTGESERLDYPKENLSFPAWGPDGGHFAAAGRTTEDGGFNEIFIVSLADKEVKSLDVSRHFPPGMRILFTLDWSPDGKTIAYDTFRIISETNLIQNIIPKK